MFLEGIFTWLFAPKWFMHPKREGANRLLGGAIPLKEDSIPLKEDLVTALHCTINWGIGLVAREVRSWTFFEGKCWWNQDFLVELKRRDHIPFWLHREWVKLVKVEETSCWTHWRSLYSVKAKVVKFFFFWINTIRLIFLNKYLTLFVSWTPWLSC